MRVLVVDDSPLARRVIAVAVARAGDEVVGEARDGNEALVLARALRPDLMTLDIEMPGADGIDVLGEVMRTCPTRVLVVSAHTSEGAETTLDALSLGALDVVLKPGPGSPPGDFAATLADALEAARQARVPGPRPPGTERPAGPGIRRPGLIVVASSTGGPSALGRFLGAFRAPPPAPVLAVQHMPAGFTERLARRLDALVPFPVREAVDGDGLIPGTVLVAPGDRHLRLRSGRIAVTDDPPIGRLRPAADVTLGDVAREAGRLALAVVLTGMGRDGLEGCRAVVVAGGQVITESPASAVVDGMPRAVREAGIAGASGAPEQLAELIEAAA